MRGLSVAVVVCAYTLDRWDDITSAIRSAAQQVPAPNELLLVVDHNDTLLERAERELVPAYPGLRVQSNRRRQGLSGARNTSLENVTSEVVVFLDDDASAEEGWLAALIAPYSDPAVIAVGGVAAPAWPVGQARPTTLPSSEPGQRGELDWVVGCIYAGQPTTAQPVRNLMGCNMSFRRAIFKRVGGFSEDLGRVGITPLGCEETELCIRASAAYPGSSIIFEPSASVRHHVSSDRLTWRYLRRRCYAEGLSKAAVSSMVGSGQALASERRYTTQILPRGLLRQLGRAAQSGDRSRALAGAVAILLGLSFTLMGYVRARVTRATPLRPPAPQLRLVD